MRLLTIALIKLEVNVQDATMSTILKTIHAILAESKIALGAKSKKGDL